MNEDEETRRLTLDEIALLREIVKWRRTKGTVFSLTCGGRGFGGAPGFAEWRDWTNGQSRSVAWDRPGESNFEQVGMSRDSRRQSYTYFAPESVGQTVDILVAYGFLPQRFSSAYRAGWEARADATDADGALDLVTWPDHAPAVPAAW